MRKAIVRLLVGLFCVPALGWCDDVPILRFHEVSPGIYRGARPDQAGLEALQKLGIKTVIDLEDDDTAVNAESIATTALGIHFQSDPMSGFWAPHDQTVNQVLALLADSSNYPIFIHCLHGEDRTGLIIGLYRVDNEHWTPAAAYEEMRSLGFHRSLLPLNHYFETKTGYED